MMEGREIEKMAYSIAHSFNRTTGIPVQLLASEAAEYLVEAHNNYDPTKGVKLSTFLYKHATNMMINNLKREEKRKEREKTASCFIHQNNPVTPDRLIEFKNKIASLNYDAKYVVSILFSTKWAEIIGITPEDKKPKHIRTALKQHLLREEWELERIQETFNEIKEVLQ